jgi:hypothetical protein
MQQSGAYGALTQRDVNLTLNGHVGTVSVFFDVDGLIVRREIDREAEKDVPLTYQWAMMAAGVEIARAQEAKSASAGSFSIH